MFVLADIVTMLMVIVSLAVQLYQRALVSLLINEMIMVVVLCNLCLMHWVLKYKPTMNSTKSLPLFDLTEMVMHSCNSLNLV